MDDKKETKDMLKFSEKAYEAARRSLEKDGHSVMVLIRLGETRNTLNENIGCREKIVETIGITGEYGPFLFTVFFNVFS